MLASYRFALTLHQKILFIEEWSGWNRNVVEVIGVLKVISGNIIVLYRHLNKHFRMRIHEILSRTNDFLI